MKLDRCELKADEPLTTFEFLSEGPKGKIEKIIQFSLVNQIENVYNLAFGDKNYLTGEIDDKIVTDNGDSEKVLASIVAAIYAFCDYFSAHGFMLQAALQPEPGFIKMGINIYFDIVESDFEIYGQIQNEWESYIKGKDYQAFIVQRKKS